MPTVKQIHGFRLVVNVRDEHGPAHVHVIKAGGEIRIYLYEEARAQYWDERRPMSDQDKVRAVRLVREHQAACLAVWRQYHGQL